MITIEKIQSMGRGEAVTALKKVSIRNAKKEQKMPLIEALEKRISNLNFDSAVVVKSEFD